MWITTVTGIRTWYLTNRFVFPFFEQTSTRYVFLSAVMINDLDN